MSGDMAMLLRAKLHPTNFTSMSGKMAAITAFVLEANWTRPAITELVITSDGIVLAQDDDQVGANTIIGSVEDLERNWLLLLSVAELTEAERAFAETRYLMRVTDFRRVLTP